MIITDKRKAIGSILAMSKDGNLTEKPNEEDQQEDSALEQIASEFIDAVHAKDPKALAEALRALMIAIQEEDQEQDAGTEPQEG